MDVRAGGGQIMTIGNILKSFLFKLEWFSTLFPRIPVPIQVGMSAKIIHIYHLKTNYVLINIYYLYILKIELLICFLATNGKKNE